VKLRTLFPATAAVAALTATTAMYRVATDADPPPRPRPDVEWYPADPAVEVLFVRSLARDLVAGEVIAGRTSVPEAAAVFAWLDALPPRCPAAAPDRIAVLAGLSDPGGYTQAELLGLRVVAQVEVMVRPASVTLGCAERVRGEFLAARAQGTFTRLPAVSEDRCARLVDQARIEARRVMSGRPDALPAQSVQ
jgi:hypothetical protein